MGSRNQVIKQEAIGFIYNGRRNGCQHQTPTSSGDASEWRSDMESYRNTNLHGIRGHSHE